MPSPSRALDVVVVRDRRANTEIGQAIDRLRERHVQLVSESGEGDPLCPVVAKHQEDPAIRRRLSPARPQGSRSRVGRVSMSEWSPPKTSSGHPHAIAAGAVRLLPPARMATRAAFPTSCSPSTASPARSI